TEAPTEKPTEKPTEAPTLPPTPLEDGVINYGESDVAGCTEIADMQARLLQLGYYFTGFTGVFDDNTLVALQDYFKTSEQKTENFITEEQYNVLMSDQAIAKPTVGVYTQEEIDTLQAMLVKLGYLTTATGVYDDETIAAVKVAQANCDMEATGELSDEFMDALELAVARADAQSGTITTTPGLSEGKVNNSVAVNSPSTGYFTSDSPSTDEITFAWLVGMMFALTLGTAVVYVKNRAARKR
ncbi:MAG: peptidoglycan-binding domain-containing protein, partial [Acutalibacteraceae bacterium]|nr:peptidoglycan-binding domain-containing protein [Acutalibacteraceae bacterium]